MLARLVGIAQTVHARRTGEPLRGPHGQFAGWIGGGAIPVTSGSHDLHGAPLPFTHAQFVQGLHDPLMHIHEGNENPVVLTTLNGRGYYIKSVPNADEPEQQQRHEVATIAAVHALGLHDIVPAEAYHLQTADGEHHVATSMELGSAHDESPDQIRAAAAAIPTATLRDASLAEYVLGMDERHAGNVLLDISNGRLKEIDFGHGLLIDMRPQAESLVREIWSQQVRPGKRGITDDSLRIPTADLQRFVGHAAAVVHTLRQYGVESARVDAVQRRFAVLRRLATSGQPVSFAQIAQATSS